MARRRTPLWAALFAAVLLASSSVSATSYLIESNLAKAQAISAAKCQTLGCDGVNTIWWWGVITNSGTGQAAVVVEDGVRPNAAGDFTSAGLAAAVVKVVGPQAVILTPQANMDPSWFPVATGPGTQQAVPSVQ